MFKSWRQASLQVSLFIRFSVLLGLVLIVFLFISVQALNASTQEALKERGTVARLMADHVDAQLSRAQQMLQSAVDSGRLTPNNDDWQAEQEALQTVYDRGVLFKHVSLLNASGQVVLRVPASETVTETEQSGLAQASQSRARNQSPFISLVDFSSNTAVIAITIPIMDSEGVKQGALLGWIDLSDPRARSLLYPYQPGKSGYSDLIDLIDQRGAVLVSTREDRIGQVSDHAGRLSSLVQGKEATVGMCHACHDADGAKRLNEVLAFAPLTNVPLGIALHQPESEVLSTTYALMREFAFLGFAVLVIFAAAVHLTTRGIARPLEELARVARQIAGGDLSRPVHITNVAELVSLGNSFEEMRGNLIRDREQLLEYQRDLERRVAERTAELTQARDHLLETNRNLTEVNAVATLLARSLDLDETLSAATRRLCRGLSADGCGVLVLDDQGGVLTLMASHGLSAEAAAALNRLSFSEIGCGGTCQPGATGEGGLCSACRRVILEKLGWASAICIPLGAEGRLLGTLFVASRGAKAFTPQDQTLLATIGWQFAVTILKARLYQTVKRREQERAELLHRIITAQEEERKRIARGLHDETTQALTALILGLDTFEVARAAEPEEAEKVERANKTIARQALEGLRRIVADLRPALLDDMGLVPAVAHYAKKRLQPLGIELRMEVEGQEDSRLSSDQEIALFRIVQEAVNNVIRHANASTVTVRFAQQDHHFLLQVEDDGQGYDPAKGLRTDGDEGGFGLQGMQERASIIGGTLRIETAEGRGTIVTVEVPLETA